MSGIGSGPGRIDDISDDLVYIENVECFLQQPADLFVYETSCLISFDKLKLKLNHCL